MSETCPETGLIGLKHGFPCGKQNIRAMLLATPVAGLPHYRPRVAMPVPMTRSIQLPLASSLFSAGRPRRRPRQTLRRTYGPRMRPLPPCPQCCGPLAQGEGVAVCVVCAYTRPTYTQTA